MRSTGLHYARNEQLPDERSLTYPLREAVQGNPATSAAMRRRATFRTRAYLAGGVLTAGSQCWTAGATDARLPETPPRLPFDDFRLRLLDPRLSLHFGWFDIPGEEGCDL
jgi:hypothetical protein